MITREKSFGVWTLTLIVSLAAGVQAWGQEATTQPDQAKAQSPSTVVATLGEHQLTRGELDSLKKYLAPDASAEQETKLIDFWKFQTAMADQARQADLESDPDAKVVLDLLKNKFMGDIFVRWQQLSVTVTDADVKGYYDQNKEKPEFRQGVYLTAKVIATEKRDEIDAIKKELVEGKDFDQLFDANKAKTVQLTGLSDPSIQNVASSLLVPNLGQGVVSAMTLVKEGEVIGPRNTPKGWVLFKVLERKPGELIPFENVQKEIRGKLLRDRQMAIGQEIVRKAQEAAGIKAGPTTRKVIPGKPTTMPAGNNDQKK